MSMNIKDVVYFPRIGGYKFTTLTCAFGIPSQQNDRGMWRRYHQCGVKGQYEIDGYKFCGTHKKIIEKMRSNESHL